MKKLFKNAFIVDVRNEEIVKKDILIEDNIIIGVGNYDKADEIIDYEGKYIVPSFIDSHIHIESSLLLPNQLSKIMAPHGTGAIIADPHEVANVSGVKAIKFMMEASKDLPLKVFYAIPSCVPATSYDENGYTLDSYDVEELIKDDDVVSLGEVMDSYKVLHYDEDLYRKIKVTKDANKVINGHCPGLRGKDLETYINAGISDDHETFDIEEAKEKISKGMHIFIRQGTAAKNLNNLIDLLDEPYYNNCCFCCDDRFPSDINDRGHIDNIIRKSIEQGKDPIRVYKVATFNAAKYYHLDKYGSIEVNKYANLVVLDNLNNVEIKDVYYQGSLVVKDKILIAEVKDVKIPENLGTTFNIKELNSNDFMIDSLGKNHRKCRVIVATKGSLFTDEETMDIDFSKHNGIDPIREIAKIAVCERHKNTGHIGLSFVKGIFIDGAIASSVSHDSHNLIILGSKEEDMAIAGNTIKEMGGGFVIVKDGKVIAKQSLKFCGLISEYNSIEMLKENDNFVEAFKQVSKARWGKAFALTSFISLVVIPKLKLCTHGLFDVEKQEIVSMFVD